MSSRTEKAGSKFKPTLGRRPGARPQAASASATPGPGTSRTPSIPASQQQSVASAAAQASSSGGDVQGTTLSADASQHDGVEPSAAVPDNARRPPSVAPAPSAAHILPPSVRPSAAIASPAPGGASTPRPRASATPTPAQRPRPRPTPTPSPGPTRGGTPRGGTSRASMSLAQPLSFDQLSARPMGQSRRMPSMRSSRSPSVGPGRATSMLRQAPMPMAAPPMSPPAPAPMPVQTKLAAHVLAETPAPVPAPVPAPAPVPVAPTPADPPTEPEHGQEQDAPHSLASSSQGSTQQRTARSSPSGSDSDDDDNDPDYVEQSGAARARRTRTGTTGSKPRGRGHPSASSRTHGHKVQGNPQADQPPTQTDEQVEPHARSVSNSNRGTEEPESTTGSPSFQKPNKSKKSKRPRKPELPTHEEEKQQWIAVWEEYQARMAEHTKIRQDKARQRDAQRDNGSDVEDTTSESEVSEPELALPSEMQGPGETASMADLTSMRWTRGIPREKTFEMTERFQRWRMDKQKLTKKAQRRLMRRMAMGKEDYQRDGDSEDSEDEQQPKRTAVGDVQEGERQDADEGEGEETRPVKPEPGTSPDGVHDSSDEEQVVGNMNVGGSDEEEVVGTLDGEDDDQDGEASPPPANARGKAPKQREPSPEFLQPTGPRKFQETGSTAQFRLRDDGTIDIDPDSLMVDRNKDAWENAQDEDIDPTVIGDEWAFTNSASFASTTRRGKSWAVSKDGESVVARAPRWSKAETQQFVSAIRLWGTDFGMVARAFPNRTRAQCVTKWRKLEKEDPALLDSVFKKKTPLKRSATPGTSGSRLGTPASSVSSRSQTPMTGVSTAVSTPRTAALTPALDDEQGNKEGEPHGMVSRAGSTDPSTATASAAAAPQNGEQADSHTSAPAAGSNRAGRQAPVEESPEASQPATQSDKLGLYDHLEPPEMTLEDWAEAAKVDLNQPAPVIDVPAHIKQQVEDEIDVVGSDNEGGSPQSTKRPRPDDDEYSEEEEIEILPDGTQNVTKHLVKKRKAPTRRGKKPPQAVEMLRDRGHAHRADVLARRTGVAGGETEELVG